MTRGRRKFYERPPTRVLMERPRTRSWTRRDRLVLSTETRLRLDGGRKSEESERPVGEGREERERAGCSTLGGYLVESNVEFRTIDSDF